MTDPTGLAGATHHEDQSNGNRRKRNPLGVITGAVLLVLLAAYAWGIVAGRLPADRRIDASAVGIIIVGCVIALFLARPELVERVSRFEALGWKLEMESRQQQQSAQLKDIELILPVLLPDKERKHLTNLAEGKTAGYKGNHDLRSELRRLRSLKLIDMLGDQHIASMTDGTTFDLANYVRLTKLGTRWAERVRQLEAELAQEAKAAGQG